MMRDVKVFNCCSFGNFTFKDSFSSEIFKVGFSEASAVKVKRGLSKYRKRKVVSQFQRCCYIVNPERNKNQLKIKASRN